MTKQFSMPLGARVRVTRVDGTEDVYDFKGTDASGAIYLDGAGQRHGDLGVYIKVEVWDGEAWQIVSP